MDNKLRIVLTGPYPPPAGGISIHIKRLERILQNDFDVTIIDEASDKKEWIFNFRSLDIISYLKILGNSDLVFVHSGNKLFKKVHIISSKLLRKKVVITLHGYGHRRRQPFRAIDSFIYGLADKIILVNNDIQNRLDLPAKKCIVKHAFLPPMMEDEPELPASVSDWLQKMKSTDHTIFCGNASRLDLNNNEDLYGLDMTIEAARRLVKSGYRAAFVFNVSSLENCQELFDRYKLLIQENGLTDRFLLLNESLSFVKLIQASDIVVRPTNADGDALTIREAIFLGKKVIASDIITRPMKTVLFQTRDHNDFEQKLRCALDHAGNIDGVNVTSDLIDEDFTLFYSSMLRAVALK